jgi:hypothetical protein
MYKEKYLKYKTKYLDLKSQIGSGKGYYLYPSKAQKAKELAEKAAAAKKAAAEKAAAKKAAAEKVAAEKEAADKENAKINDINKSSKTFANAYKSQHINSHKIKFKFVVIKKYHKSYSVNGKRRNETKERNIIMFEHFFIYDSKSNNIYMSDDTYSPEAYNKYFSTYKLNINTFFTKLIELLIYTQLLQDYMPQFLNGDKINEFLEYLLPIREHIKLLFNIDLSEDNIKITYNMTDDSYKNKWEIDEYRCVSSFSIDDNDINELTIDMKNRLGLDDTIDGFASDFFNKKKTEMKAKFMKAVERKNAECAQNKYDKNCREPKQNLNAMWNEIMNPKPE